MTKLIVITPTFNSSDTIDRTISSVVNQSGDFEVHFHVQDGGSTDETLIKLQNWKKLIESGSYPIGCNNFIFTYAREPDEGMYQAIANGFAKCNIKNSDWLTWINSDDIIMPMAFSLINAISTQESMNYVKWVTGCPSTAYFDGRPLTSGVRYFNKKIVSLGLCDGIHYDFFQQEGTFFKAELWKKIDIKKDFQNFKLAGDWNLWRKFAEYSEIFQVQHPLGTFFRMKNQKSSLHREAYTEEIIKIQSKEDSKKKLMSFMNEDAISHIIKSKYSDGSIYLEKHNFINYVDRYKKKFQPKLPVPKAYKTDFVYAGNMLFFDEDWQFPAITEKHAFRKIKELIPELDKRIVYLAFPWATLIDLKKNKPDIAIALENKLTQAKEIFRIIKPTCVVTTCQHILMKEFFYFFEDLGVTDIFWAHAKKEEPILNNNSTINIHAFPLFPVQCINNDLSNLDESRDILYSFVGARADSWYLKQTRNWILDKLSDDKSGYVVGKNEWHFNKIVYDHQISGAKNENLINKSNEEEFVSILKKSVFSLCPSGSGPNTIRLWESIGFGSIPVILSDYHRLPGDIKLWNKSAIIFDEIESNISKLPALLKELAEDNERIESMRSGLRIIWAKYGPQNFVYDILLLFQEKSDKLLVGGSSRNKLSFSYVNASLIDDMANNPIDFKRFEVRMFIRELTTLMIAKKDDLRIILSSTNNQLRSVIDKLDKLTERELVIYKKARSLFIFL